MKSLYPSKVAAKPTDSFPVYWRRKSACVPSCRHATMTIVNEWGGTEYTNCHKRSSNNGGYLSECFRQTVGPIDRQVLTNLRNWSLLSRAVECINNSCTYWYARATLRVLLQLYVKVALVYRLSILEPSYSSQKTWYRAMLNSCIFVDDVRALNSTVKLPNTAYYMTTNLLNIDRTHFVHIVPKFCRTLSYHAATCDCERVTSDVPG